MAAFEKDGFVVLRGFLNREQLEEARREADSSISAVRAQQGAKFIGVAKALESHSRYFKEQLLRGAHVPLMEALVGDALAPASAGYFDKLQGGRDVPVAPHADSGGQRNGATLWIALDRADTRNGCVTYLRGSHKRTGGGAIALPMGSKPFAIDEAFEESLDGRKVFRFIGRTTEIQPPQPPAQFSRVRSESLVESCSSVVVYNYGDACAAEPGDAVVHSSMTVHWSRQSAAPEKQRRAVTYFYWAASSADLEDAPGLTQKSKSN